MNKRKFILALILGVASMLLAACDSDSSSGTDSGELSSSLAIRLSSGAKENTSSSSFKSLSSSSNTEVKVAWDYLNPNITYGEITDDRDGQVYKTVVIGTQTWMAQNLNYEMDSIFQFNNWCYENSADSCAKYGRLYTWGLALSACPVGWHVPDTTELHAFINFVNANNGDEGVGTSLKSTTGWNAYPGIATGTDRFGFSAIPIGYSDNFYGSGSNTYFWSVTEGIKSYKGFTDYAFYMSLLYNGEISLLGYYKKSYAFSIRCLKDSE